MEALPFLLQTPPHTSPEPDLQLLPALQPDQQNLPGGSATFPSILQPFLLSVTLSNPEVTVETCSV